MEGDETVTEGPFLHRLLQDHLLRKDDHVDVVKLAKTLQDLSHGLGFRLLHHGTYANHNLPLWWLVERTGRTGAETGRMEGDDESDSQPTKMSQCNGMQRKTAVQHRQPDMTLTGF